MPWHGQFDLVARTPHILFIPSSEGLQLLQLRPHRLDSFFFFVHADIQCAALARLARHWTMWKCAVRFAAIWLP